MHPFHEILLYTRHASVIQTLPQQIFHRLGNRIHVLHSWQEPERPPFLLICDETTCDELREYLPAHPTMAVLVLGNHSPFPEHSTLSALPVHPAEILNKTEGLLFTRLHDLWGYSLPLGNDLFYTPKERNLHNNTHAQELTDKEHLLLITLYHFAPHPVTRAFLLENVFGYADSAETHTLETHLSRLRGKWKELAPDERILHAEGGYVLATSP